MNQKNIAKHLKYKMDHWLKHIDNDDIKDCIKQNAIITGGSIVSLLLGEEPNDYDIYFKNFDSCRKVADYYATKWNETHPEKHTVDIRVEGEEYENDETPLRITAFIRSKGIVTEDGESPVDDMTEFAPGMLPETTDPNEVIPEKPKYRPRYFSSNAISLADKVQLVIRFYGPVDKIHENYDFTHCKCSYDYATNEVNLPAEALECIITKELRYSGSRYPLCSIIRIRKYVSKGWHINAGQILKMCLQLGEYDLHDFKVFRDQITGVDSAYFEQVMDCMVKKQEDDPSFNVDNTYLFSIINQIFG